jgi:hypothetical protein
MLMPAACIAQASASQLHGSRLTELSLAMNCGMMTVRRYLLRDMIERTDSQRRSSTFSGNPEGVLIMMISRDVEVVLAGAGALPLVLLVPSPLVLAGRGGAQERAGREGAAGGGGVGPHLGRGVMRGHSRTPHHPPPHTQTNKEERQRKRENSGC